VIYTLDNIEEWDFRQCWIGSPGFDLEANDFLTANYPTVLAVEEIRLILIKTLQDMNYVQRLDSAGRLRLRDDDRRVNKAGWSALKNFKNVGSFLTAEGRLQRKVAASLYREYKRYGCLRVSILPSDADLARQREFVSQSSNGGSEERAQARSGQSTERADARAKIDKLLDLARRAGTPHERDVALAKAEQLAAKYGFKIRRRSVNGRQQSNPGGQSDGSSVNGRQHPNPRGQSDGAHSKLLARAVRSPTAAGEMWLAQCDRCGYAVGRVHLTKWGASQDALAHNALSHGVKD
jgi:hypothetical protein